MDLSETLSNLINLHFSFNDEKIFKKQNEQK
jgi:hypothetical protein